MTGIQPVLQVPAGTVLDYAGATAPAGYLLCDGSAVSRTTYAALFAIIGTDYGVGNGTTTFNVPDCRGRTSIGAGTGSGLTARTRAATVGNETHALSVAELATHGHTPAGDAVYRYTGTGTDGWNWSVSGGGNQQATIGITIPTAGSGTAHNNMQPSIVFNKIIKA